MGSNSPIKLDNSNAYDKWAAFGSDKTAAANLDLEKKLKESGTVPPPAGSGTPSVFGFGYAAN